MTLHVPNVRMTIKEQTPIVTTLWLVLCRLLTSVNSVVCIQLMLQTEPFGAVLALVGFFCSVVVSMGVWFGLYPVPFSAEATPYATKCQKL